MKIASQKLTDEDLEDYEPEKLGLLYRNVHNYIGSLTFIIKYSST